MASTFNYNKDLIVTEAYKRIAFGITFISGDLTAWQRLEP